MGQDELQASFRALDRSFLQTCTCSRADLHSTYGVLECLSEFQLLQLAIMCGVLVCVCVWQT